MPDFRALVRSRIAHLQLEGKQEFEIVEELAADLEQRFDELLRGGATIHQAQRRIFHQLDGLRVAPKPEAPTIGLTKGNFMSSFRHDLKVAFRMLLTKPAFASMVIGMLALGIAGNTAIFSIFNTLLLRPLPFRDPQQLIDIDETAPKWNLNFVSVNEIDYFGWRDNNQTLSSLAAYSTGGANLSDPSGTVQRINVARVTANLLDTFGLTLAAGRNFTPEEDKPGTPNVVLLGYDLWQTLYHGDPSVVGRVVKLSELPATIIGILPRDAILPANIDAWVPLGADPNRAGSYYLSTVGRLKPGITIDQARADLLRVHKITQERHHDESPTSPVLTPLRDRALGDLKSVTRILFAAVAVVLLIACVNIAGLMLVRGESRSREVAIRAALGASRGALVRQLLTESLLLAATGGIIGVALGNAALHALISMIPSDVPKWLRFDMDWRFAVFAVALTGAAAVLFGLFPALQTASADVRGCMQETSRSTISRGKGRILAALAICEVALAVVLLTGAALVVEAFKNALQVDPGFRAGHLLTANIRLAPSKYPKADQIYAFYSTLLDRIRELPGVAAASAASIIPLGGHSGYFFDGEGSPHMQDTNKPVTLHVTAMPGYIEAMGMTMLAGRTLEARDEVPGAPKVAIVNESFANYYWPGQNPIGKRIRYYPMPNPEWFQVVGLVKDNRHYGLDQPMRQSVFLPVHVNANNAMTLAVRTAGDPESLAGPIRDITRQLDPNLPLFDVHTMTDRVDRSLWTRRVYSWLFGVFAGVAVLLAAAGIYGVISFTVSQRTREIGIRMALGARPQQVMASVLKTGMLLVVIGIVIGTAVSFAATNLIRSMLFNVSPREAGVYLAVVAGIAIIGALANYAPARRAAGVDPMRALRME